MASNEITLYRRIFQIKISLLLLLTACAISHDRICSQKRSSTINKVFIFQTVFAVQIDRFIEDKNICKELSFTVFKFSRNPFVILILFKYTSIYDMKFINQIL